MANHTVAQENSNAGTRFDLAGFQGSGYHKGRPRLMQLLWLMASRMIVMQWWCPGPMRVQLLRIFGAQIGEGTIIRADVKIHWPWKLTVGSHTWIGEQVWILNLEPVTIGANTCISQAAFICTGSHDRRSPTFEFDNAPIAIGDSVWIATRATVLRGVRIGDGATVGAAAVVARDVPGDEMVVAPPSGPLDRP
ncbi:putative colanic acid biosynthesis acetyltransferase [Mycolicibacterium flavescens]|uniref:Acetyltransferase n=1 Tax=Mycolicibacterium flavescens TaxID=1776 RepID=A0A1E3RK65_MYCFV|nr:acetyltransferase [Mycolicibacterium flavescens]MCV7282569.1 putative colanic acid biosynthesis acetyltransferase [Mycolicibacterium flavescens]ODQ90249.1 acetyltransferase [Mycolicibacterium flavescens]